MKDKIAKDITNKTFLSIFDLNTKITKAEILKHFAFDIKLPVMVNDSTTGEETWAESMNPTKYITQQNSEQRETWMLEKRQISSVDDIIATWREINYTTTERNYNSENVFESDTVYSCDNVIRSADCNDCHNIMFCDGCQHCNYCIASQRSGNCEFCLRVDDSSSCTNSYNVICSGKISNSFFIQDCSDLHECIFCAHINNKRYCIANMQFEKAEYFKIKDEIIKWIFSEIAE
ncbi:MAG: hypothetical protein Q4C24_01955 [Candidatus Saccharibacteria bacterium]|nr:hypothetical protein [Candidatus Saccharibacteria bacterium]